MAVKITSVKCPECGAALQIENGREQIFCSYCGAKILITNENEYIIRHVDDAGVKKAETERIVEMKKLEIIEKNRIDNEKKKKTKIRMMIIASILLGIISIVFFTISSMDEKYSNFFFIALSIFYAIPCIWLGNNTKEDELDFGDKIKIPSSLIDYSKKNYIAVESILKSVGFTNIKSIPLNDLAFGVIKKPDMVESITINGRNPSFSKRKYSSESEIIISYHSYRNS